MLRKLLAALLLLTGIGAHAATFVGVSPAHPVAGEPVLVIFDLSDSDYLLPFTSYRYGARLVAFLNLDDTPHPPQGTRREAFSIGSFAPGAYNLEVYVQAPAAFPVYSGALLVVAEPLAVPTSGALGLLLLSFGILVLAVLTRRSTGLR